MRKRCYTCYVTMVDNVDLRERIMSITPEEFPEAIPPSVPNVAPVCSSTSKYSSSVRKCAYCGSVAKCDKACEHCGAPQVNLR